MRTLLFLIFKNQICLFYFKDLHRHFYDFAQNQLGHCHRVALLHHSAHDRQSELTLYFKSHFVPVLKQKNALLQEINLRFKDRLPFPLPWEMVVVIFSDVASYFGFLHLNYGVPIVGEIPRG